MALKLNTFNCRGLQDYFKRKKIFHYLKNSGADISFLQETHSEPKDNLLWKSQWGEVAYFSSFNSASRGTAILIRNSVSFRALSTFSDPEGRFIVIKAIVNDLNMTLVNIYSPNNDEPDFLLKVFAEVDKLNSPILIIGGDFNLVIGPLDYKGTNLQHSNKKSSEMLHDLMEETGLVDVWRHFHPNLRQYTRHQKNPRVLSRLDFILVSSNFIDNCVSSKILPGIQSDHSMVQFSFNDNLPKRGKGFWKINCNYLRNDSEFLKLIKTTISDFKENHKNSDCNPNILWDSLKCVITGVCIEYSSRMKKERNKEKNKLLLEIDNIRLQISNSPPNLSDNPLLIELEELEEKLNKIYDFETKGLITRSRVRWVEEGEKSTKYFSNLENRGWQKKNISRLKNTESNMITNPAEVLKELQTFYTNLYTSQDDVHDTVNGNVSESFFDNINIPQLSEDQKQSLHSPLTKQELFNIVKSMNMNKTPGFDGLPAEFYLVFWADVSDLLMNSLNFSLQNGEMSPSQRNGIITLLPKKDRDPLLVKNYRPITLLTTDYKILAKCYANRLKRCLPDLIHPDQSGFMKGRNISHNIRLLLDIIEYTDLNDIPGCILLLDIEKAFDSVSHNFLFRVLEKFNFSKQFIDSIKTLYANRQSYVLNNGFLTDRIPMKRGIFQGCPISPYLFLLVIEIMAIYIRQNDKIKGIPIQNHEVKLSLFADDSVCYLDGSDTSFSQLFITLVQFGRLSGCKLNFTKTEAIWIGSKKGHQDFPYTDRGVSWKNSKFKCLGVTFSLNSTLLFDLNYKEKLKQMERVINCWKMRNLSLIGRVCVIKTLVLPQLIYLFSVLSIKLPSSFFKTLNTMFFKFIWNGGNDRVQRKVTYNDYTQAGLKMIDISSFATAQKMMWVKLLLDENFDSPWKCIELLFLEKFNQDKTLLWQAYAPESILNSLGNIQLAEALRSWYLYREIATVEFYGSKFSDLSACQCLWFNKLIRSKSKPYFFYLSWYDKKLSFISDLFNPPLPGYKLYEELILDYGIPDVHRRKYNFLIKNIPEEWITNFDPDIVGVHDTIVLKLINTKKVPQSTYKLLLGSQIPTKRYEFWNETVPVPSTIDWEKVHKSNYFCTIDTKLRSFYFKLFHKAIALNDFLFKIKRKISPNCSFCDKEEETIIHLFCKCEKVNPIWQDLISKISKENSLNLNINDFDKMFGIRNDKFVTYLFLLMKYHIYVCKFTNTLPNFLSFKSYVKNQKEIEYHIAKKKNKLSTHFKKWRFEI